VRVRHRAGGGSTVEETCARDSAQAAEVRSQRVWCGGESVQGTLGCAQGTRGGRRVRSALEWQVGAQTPNGLVEVCPSVLGVGWSMKARWTLTMGTFTVSHVVWPTTQCGRDHRISGRDCCKTPSTFNRHATFRV
jgi:hypothetical protein